VVNGLGVLRDRLVAEGEAALSAPPKAVEFTKDPEANLLLNDIAGHPHAFVCASLVDRQVPAELAWLVPSKIRERLGSFEFLDLKPLTEDDWLRLMREPEPAHRFPEVMARVLHRATQRIASSYAGVASRIWADEPSSATIVRRFLEFYGAGPKIATMASNILVRDFHVRLRDYRYIDISADVQVCRVMGRLGFVEEGTRPEVVVYAARELNPDFPGIFDLALWEIGRTICRPTKPLCTQCPLQDLCAYAVRVKQ
jgi:endonuclease III